MIKVTILEYTKMTFNPVFLYHLLLIFSLILYERKWGQWELTFYFQLIREDFFGGGGRGEN